MIASRRLLFLIGAAVSALHGQEMQVFTPAKYGAMATNTLNLQPDVLSTIIGVNDQR